MNDQEILERARRAARGIVGPDEAYEALLRRRHRTLRNRRITAGVVGMAVFVAAVLVVTSVGSLDRSDSSVDPAAEGTGPVEPVQIGTVTRSGAECVLEIDAEPIPSGPGRLTVVNNTNQVTAFDLFYLDPDLLTFSAFEEFVAADESGQPGAFVLNGREVGPGASGTIVDNFTSGDTFAVVCASLDPGPPPNVPAARIPFALVGPIVVPGGAGTGPTETGPTTTESAGLPDAGWDGTGLPPEGAAPSTPEEGELVAHYGHPQSAGFVYVYADGRVISHAGVGNQGRDGIHERRLTPEGVELVRSGAVKAERFQLSSNPFPADAWEDPEARPYVPSRYGICVDPTHLDMLPLRAVAVLGGPENRVEGCFEVTTPEARTLDDILSDAGYERIVGGGGASGVVLTFDTSDRLGEITFQAFLPHGELLTAF